uniref:UPAR/Ly6 domain-containing protein n=1 Tax=Parascaris univalens TaxID=6257 RepID=A0A915C6L5_PARUN
MILFVLLPATFFGTTDTLRCIDDTQSSKLITCSNTYYCLWLYGKDKSSSDATMVTLRSCYDPIHEDFCDDVSGYEGRYSIKNLDGSELQIACCRGDGCNSNIRPQNSESGSSPFLYSSKLTATFIFITSISQSALLQSGVFKNM